MLGVVEKHLLSLMSKSMLYCSKLRGDKLALCNRNVDDETSSTNSELPERPLNFFDAIEDGPDDEAKAANAADPEDEVEYLFSGSESSSDEPDDDARSEETANGLPNLGLPNPIFCFFQN